MAPQVEASSLSDLTQLAANPPKYPRNPTESQRSPLTLYLARVPGSRDIILTTLKPQLKNVTAEDVASSLYFLHLNTDDDLKLFENDDLLGNGILEEAEPDSHMSLPRKPLPEASRSSLDISWDSNYPPNPPTTAIPRRKPLTAQASPIDSHLTESKPLPTLPRRPLGPRNPGTEGTTPRENHSGIENARPNPTTIHQSCGNDTGSWPKPGLHVSITGKESSSGFSITLIRRDPSSGAQWNVGTICGTPTLVDQQRGKNSKKPYFDITVHLTTPGYNQFRNTSSGPTEGTTNSPSGQPRLETGFIRQVRMEGSSIWARSPAHKRATSDEDSINSRGRHSTDLRSPFPSEPGNESSSFTSNETGSKGYIFTSPWNGFCKFSTGSGGRSLRCKHSLPAPISASRSGDFTSMAQPPSLVSELRFNLPSSAIFSSSKPKDPAGTEKRSSVDMGIFKRLGHSRNKSSPEPSRNPRRPALPPRPHPTSYAALYPSDDEQAPPLPPRSPNKTNLRPPVVQASSYVQGDAGQHERYSTNSDDGDDDDRLDLSIGREKAGGGNRGKRAKLGKLIIHDEGLKMLDLTVAANMGIWWSVWESDNR